MARKPTAYDKKYNAAYEAQPEQVKNREARNLARAHALKAGLVHKGDGKDVDHKKPLINGGTTTKSNLRVVDEKTNRGWRKGSATYDPSKQKK
jgi:hypothetical protein